ncbi:MAG: hypothetical protein KJO76_00525 [Gammaproteobacteria bacterium]|nr:hypothetical protein [Gammaproteobacteria bacterium]MBT8444647.1 hypothetical protein [Gammaproteobacteria bacterium]NND36474.1 hypothetical protein [Gammaproteobacteria bacterium]
MASPDKPAAKVLAEIEIRGLEAVWVLLAHLYAILVPIVLVLVTNHHWDYLVATIHAPVLFYVAALLMVAGSTFEIAQNAIDNWYLTPETASANGVGFCDMFAFWFFTAGQALIAVGLAGDAWWVVATVVVALIWFPISYLTQTGHFGASGVVGILVAILGYQAFGDPVVILPFFLAFATMAFFTALLETGAQVLHGFTTIAASSGIWFFAWAMHNGDAGTPNSWLFAATILVIGAAAVATARQLMMRLPASERVVTSSV